VVWRFRVLGLGFLSNAQRLRLVCMGLSMWHPGIEACIEAQVLEWGSKGSRVKQT